jgi:membrane fusion protein (multidrug efflux system)
MSRFRSIPWVILALASTTLVGCFQDGKADVQLDELRAYVKVQPVSRGELIDSLELTGTVQAIRQVDLIATGSGRVEDVAVEIGQMVQRGDLLVRIDADLASLQLQQAQAAVKLGELAFVNATREFARATTLHEKGSLPDQAFEQAQAGMEMAEQQLAQAQAAMGLAREQLEGSRLVAPFDGMVTYVGVEEEEFFNPMSISPMAGPAGLVGLVDDSAIKIDLQVADSDIGKLSRGMSARIFVDALGDRVPARGLVGRIESVGLAADATTRTFPVRVVADNPDHTVLAGTHARVKLVLDEQPLALYVPEAAVRGGEGGAYVMVLEGDRARKIEVGLGLAGDDGVEITDGLKDGDLVITKGNFGLADGALVEVTS